MSDICPICKRDYSDLPIPIVVHAFLNGQYVLMCPLCYADDHLVRHGTKWHPTGEIASMMFELAKQHIAEVKL